MPQFVSTCNQLFDLGDGPSVFSGVNCYFLAYCSEESRRAALRAAWSMGAQVIRCWSFLEVDDWSSGRVAFQSFENGAIVTHAGPDGLERLDDLILAADELNLKLVLPLVNHWGALGGMPRYVRWLGAGSDVTEFYRSAVIRAAYQNWVRTVLTRRNTRTGRLYSDEPAIMAWELTNEARCPVPGGRELLLDWISEMAQFVKRLDHHHLLGLGDEGFFFKKGLLHWRGRKHLYDGRYGVDWVANLKFPEIDFGTFHFYPQDWGLGDDLGFAERWINDHANIAAKVQKPVILEEFGLKLDAQHVSTEADRQRWYEKWKTIVAKSGSAGSLVWMLGHKAPDTIGYTDDFVIHAPSRQANDLSGQGKVKPG